MLYIPTVKLDTNTEVIVRNMVAYEASATLDAVVFKRYIDFLDGMVNGREDLKLSRMLIFG